MNIEIWKDIEGYEGLYQISNSGNVKSVRYQKDRIIFKTLLNSGYLKVIFSVGGVIEHFLIHRLIAKAFIVNNENKKEVNHINGIKTDNRVENLEWCTKSQNHLHKYHVLGYKGSAYGKYGKYNKSSKKVRQIKLDGTFVKDWDSLADIGRELHKLIGHISNCCRGKRKTAFGYKWEFII